MLGAVIFAVFAWRVLDPRTGLFRQAADETGGAGWSLLSLLHFGNL